MNHQWINERNMRTKKNPNNLCVLCLCCSFIELTKCYIFKYFGYVPFQSNLLLLLGVKLNKEKITTIQFLNNIMMFFARNNIWFRKSIVKKITFLTFKWNGNEFPMNWETDEKCLKKKGNVCLWWVCNVHVIGLWRVIRWIISFWVLCTNSFFGIIVALTWFLFGNAFNFSWRFFTVFVLITAWSTWRFLGRMPPVATYWAAVWFPTTFFFFAGWFSWWFAALGRSATSPVPIDSFPFSTFSSLSFICSRPWTTSLLEYENKFKLV